MLDLLFKVSVEDKGSNPKVFWSSYPKDWVKLTDTQRNKARSFWTNLTALKQQELIVAARQESDKAPPAPAPVAGPARERPTTKHDNFYENVGVAYREVEGSERPVKVNPYVARDPAYLAIVAKTHDIEWQCVTQNV